MGGKKSHYPVGECGELNSTKGTVGKIFYLRKIGENGTVYLVQFFSISVPFSSTTSRHNPPQPTSRMLCPLFPHRPPPPFPPIPPLFSISPHVSPFSPFPPFFQAPKSSFNLEFGGGLVRIPAGEATTPTRLVTAQHLPHMAVGTLRHRTSLERTHSCLGFCRQASHGSSDCFIVDLSCDSDDDQNEAKRRRLTGVSVGSGPGKGSPIRCHKTTPRPHHHCPKPFCRGNNDIWAACFPPMKVGWAHRG